MPGEGYLPRGVPAQGVYLPGGVPAGGYLHGGWCTCPIWGVPAQGVPVQVLPPCEQSNRQVQKYYLAPNIRLRAVMMGLNQFPLFHI